LEIAADYPFLDILGTMLVFFGFVVWFTLLIKVFADVFRRHDIGGFAKFMWSLFVIVVPLLGVLIYLIAEGKEMGRRDVEHIQAQKADFDAYVRQTAGGGGPAGEIAHAKQLLESGDITQPEFDRIKQNALAAT
jgi:Phospholipase_D-nuclease N-terminal